MPGNPLKRICDVIVVGGGPAGAAAAIRLAQGGFFVTLLERTKQSPASLGETLPPHSRLILSRLGLWDAFLRGHHLASSGITAYWGPGAARENDFLFNAHGCGWYLGREQFDACLLAEAEQRGVRVVRQTRALACVQEKGSVVRVQLAENAVTLSARFVIDATGRPGLVRRYLSHSGIISIDRLVGLVVISPANPIVSARTVIEATELGWWYSAPVPEGGLACVFFTDADFVRGTSAETLWKESLKEAPATEARVKAAAAKIPVAAPRIVSASTLLSERVGGECWAAVGDAAMAWDPLSSQGICKALESGFALAEAYECYEGGDSKALERFFVEVKEDFFKYMVLRASYYTQETRWPNSIFWRRRAVTSMT